MRLDFWKGLAERSTGERGFTLGELLLVASLLTFAATGVKSFISHSRGDDRSREEDLYRELTTQGRGAVDRMVQEVTQAGTPALQIAGSPESGSIPTAANSNRVAAQQFLVATPTQIIFEADLDRDGAVERVEYRLNGELLERSAVSKHSDGTVPDARFETVVEHVDNGALPLFSYPTDPFTAAGVTPSVRILLLLRAPAEKPNKQPYRTVGFEGIASLQNAAQVEPVEQGAVPSEPAQQGAVESQQDAPPDIASGSLPHVRAIYATKWTMR